MVIPKIKVTLTIRQPEINRVVGSKFKLDLDHGSLIVDVIKAVDRQMMEKQENFRLNVHGASRP